MLPANRLRAVANLRIGAAEVKREALGRISSDTHLLYQLVRRDFRIRFTGSALGVFWAVLQPLSLVILYWFVFTVMIPVPRLPGASGSDYVLYLISGLLPWIGFSEGVMRGTTAIVENGSMVRRLPFRSELLVVVPNVTASIFSVIGIGLFAAFLLYEGRSLSGIWLLPFALLLQFMLQLGLAWVLATLHVFLRDVVQVLGFLLSIIFYLSPILYRIEGPFEHIFVWNPLTPLLGLFRSALIGAPLPGVASIVFLMTVIFALFSGGLWFFRRARGTMVDLV